jgi:hypothetical protein
MAGLAPVAGFGLQDSGYKQKMEDGRKNYHKRQVSQYRTSNIEY